MKSFALAVAMASITVGVACAADKFNPTDAVVNSLSKMKVGKYDWPQWGGSSYRNNTPEGKDIPTEWNLDTGENVLWAVPLGSQTYGNPVVANGKVFVGTNNTHGYLKRYPSKVDLGCLLAFDEKTGKFLWQCSSTKLPSGRVNDWPLMGICSTVCCDDTRVWYNTSRGEVLCLDVEGFADGENDGPFKAEPNENKDEADIIWRYDLMGSLGVFQHNMCSCSLTCAGDYCFVITGNGVDDDHINIPAPNAPSFICLDKNTGKLLWSDKSPGLNILHGQWSSPCAFEIGGQAQVVMGGGDGWIYSFDPAGDGKGAAKLLWKFDGNPKVLLFSMTAWFIQVLAKTPSTVKELVTTTASTRRSAAILVWSWRLVPMAKRCHLGVCSASTPRRARRRFQIPMPGPSGTSIRSIATRMARSSSKKQCIARLVARRSRMICCSSLTSPVSFTAWMPRRPKTASPSFTGLTTCSLRLGDRC
jgi:outer membrane protein assembly factor BamB